ncbi:MAG: glycosyltransferase family 39 protein [Candidatus Zixiibacteriota bacterium]|nr:MAG: glycosyltransferase family 39 protein [candidate division Zixibacteria bacterium]
MNLVTYPGFPLDDSWIHQVFARNIAGGHGFSFNPGIPIAGATAPLWTLLLVPMWLLFGPITGGIALGMITQWLAILAVYKLTERLTEDKSLSFLASILSALCWPVIWGALSGMEIGLYSALSLWGLYFCLKSNSPDDRYSYLSYFLFTLAFLARPECGIFLAAAFIHDFYVWIKSGYKKNIHWLFKLFMIAAITLPYFIFNFKTSGTFFPRTFGFKVQDQGLLASIFEINPKGIIKALTILPLHYFKLFLYSLFRLNPLLFCAIFAGIVRILKWAPGSFSKRLSLILIIVLYIPILGSVAPAASPDYQNYRYITNLLPLFIILAVAGFLFPLKKKISRVFLYSGSILISLMLLVKIILVFFGDYIIGITVQEPANINADYLKNVDEFVMGIAIDFTLILLFYIIAGSILSTRLWSRMVNRVLFRTIVIILLILFSAGSVLLQSPLYATNVRNVNERNVEAAILLRTLANEGDIVAVNDAGAIGYFSGMEIIDLKGIISPEITLEMVKDDSMAFEYMSRSERVDYLAIVPDWFDYIPLRTDIFKEIASLTTEKNLIVYGDTTKIYKAYWIEDE